MLGEEFDITREGADGSLDRALKRLRELDGTVDAIGLGGIDVYLYAGAERYTLRDGQKLLDAVKITPVVDGSGLKNTLEREAVGYLQSHLGFDLRGKRVLMVSALDRFGMAQALVAAGADVIFGDFIFALDLDRPVRGLDEFEEMARKYLPDACKLPFQFFYPTGKKQDRPPQPKYPEYYDDAEIIAGDFHFVRQYMPERLDGKIVLTNTVTQRDIEELRDRGVATLITTTPDFDGRSFGTNVVEAALLSMLGKKWAEVTEADYDRLLRELHLVPARHRFNGRMNVWRRLVATQPVERLTPERHGGAALRRVLGIGGLIGVGLGTMLGGIFTTIGAGAQAAGAGGVLGSFALTGLVCVFVALCYAELASMVPIAGSAYTYAYATLGEFIAWIIGWDLILEYGISVAPTASAWSGYVQSFLSTFGFSLPPSLRVAHMVTHGGSLDLVHSSIDLPAIVAVLAIAALLAVGMRESSRTNTIFVAIQVLAIGIFVVALFGAVSPAQFHPAFPTGASGVIAGAALVFFAYIGFDTVTVASEEAREPARDVPRAVIGSLIVGIVLYMLAAYVTVGIVPWKTIDTNAAMADAVHHAGNARWLNAVIFAGAFAGTTTVMLTSLLGQVRIFYVMARDNMLPPFVARINPKTGTPVATTFVTGVLVALLAGVIPIEALLALVNVGTLSAFAIVCVGVFVLRLRKPDAPRPFRAPFIWVTAPAGALLCVLVMTGLGTETWLRFVVWFAVGLAVYMAYGFRHSLLRKI